MMQDETTNTFGITENEALWDRLTKERLIELINQPDVEVRNYRYDTNSFGDYWFITLKKGDQSITSYGNGENFNGTVFLYSEWGFYTQTWTKHWEAGYPNVLSKKKVLSQIVAETVKVASWMKQDNGRDSTLL